MLYVSITQNDIDSAIAERQHNSDICTCCPVVQAVKRSTGAATVEVNSTGIWVDGTYFELHDEAACWLRRFDDAAWPSDASAFVRESVRVH